MAILETSISLIVESEGLSRLTHFIYILSFQRPLSHLHVRIAVCLSHDGHSGGQRSRFSDLRGTGSPPLPPPFPPPDTGFRSCYRYVRLLGRFGVPGVGQSACWTRWPNCAGSLLSPLLFGSLQRRVPEICATGNDDEAR